MKRKTKK